MAHINRKFGGVCERTDPDNEYLLWTVPTAPFAGS